MRIRRGRPGRNGRRPGYRNFSIAHENSDEGVRDRFRHRPTQDRRFDAIARSVTFGDDPAVMRDHDRLGQAWTLRARVGKFMLDCGDQRRIVWRHHVRPGDGRKKAWGLWRSHRWLVHRTLHDQASLGATIDRATPETAGECCRYLLALTVEVVAHQGFENRQIGSDEL